MNTRLRYSTATALSLCLLTAGASTANAAEPEVATAPSATAPAVPPPAASGLPAAQDSPTPPASDPAADAERARVVAKGKRLVSTGSVFSLISIVGLAVTAVSSARGNTGGAIASAGVSVLLAGTGLALIVPGRRRVRMPERFMKTKKVAIGLAPVLTRRTQGAALSLRF